MSTDELDSLVSGLVRTATRIEPHADSAARAASVHGKFGGAPYAEAGDTWPVCTGCDEELEFVVQLEDPSADCLHQFFYCFECFPWGSGPDEDGQWAIRSHHGPSMDRHVEMTRRSASEPEVTPCTVTVSSVRVLPSWDGIDSVSAAATELARAVDPDRPWAAYAAAVERQDCLDDYATLVGGYPRFVQGEVASECPTCRSPMAFFAQIDTEDEAGIMWGDVGLVYLFRCAEHPTQFEMELQCH